MVDSAAATIRVVVDLPFVPVTTAVRRPVPSWRSTVRSRVIATRPPIIAPAPRPVTRDAQRAADPSASAERPRRVIVGFVFGVIAGECIRQSPGRCSTRTPMCRTLSGARAILSL